MKPELLAPAGSPEALHAAVASGADAVYLGWGAFNARRGAKNFSDEEFADAVTFCHEHGVKVYLTLNTLVTDRELPVALAQAECASDLGVDAVLVQDLGLLAMLRTAVPDLPLHASTQMSLFTAGGVYQAAQLGCKRVVLARECSREDTARICRDAAAEIEIFAHGALCMSYSGQCAMSALIGGRSGNRGRCAQPCRLPYSLDGRGGMQYPLSLKDCCMASSLGEAEDLGVACLKLEGRMKRAEYVAVVTRIYARLLQERRGPTPAESSALEQAFSRSGFTNWYWLGKTGVGMFGIRPENAAEPKELFAQAMVRCEKEPLNSVPILLLAQIRTGEASRLTARDSQGHCVQVSGPVPEAARTRPLTKDAVCARLSKTGGTAYICAEVQVELDEGLSLSAAAVNALRREALHALTDARTAPARRRHFPVPPLRAARFAAKEPSYTLSLSRAEQLTPALLALEPARILLPLELFASLPHLPACRTHWCAVMPRVWRDRDEPLLRRLLEQAKAAGVNGIYVTNLGQLPLLKDSSLPLYGDYGLNVFNGRTLCVLEELGLSSATLSFELRLSQLRDLPKVLETEAIVYGRLPLMLTENCLLRNAGLCRPADGSLLPAGKLPCDGTHHLIDRTGAAFPLFGSFGHRTEIENCRPLYLADRNDWKQLGLTYARLRFLEETPEECVRIFQAYRSGAAPWMDFTRGLIDRGVE